MAQGGTAMNTTASLTLTVEVTPGSDIAQASSALCELADTLNVYVRSDFNGCRLFVKPSDNPLRLIAIYRKHQEKKE
jgi:hypothetical protein